MLVFSSYKKFIKGVVIFGKEMAKYDYCRMIDAR